MIGTTTEGNVERMFPLYLDFLKVYGTSRTTKSSAESRPILVFLGEGIMNREICIYDLQVFIEILNLWGIDEFTCVETGTYP